MKATFDPKKLLKVKIDQVTPNPWNPKQKNTKEYENVKKSVEQKGLRAPVVVRELEPGVFEIIDGEQRFTSAKELGYKELYVYNEGTMDEAEAKSLTIWYQQQVPFDQVELADLVVELHNLEIELPFTAVEIKDFEEMSSFDFDQYQKVEDDGSDDTPDVKTVHIVMQADKYEIVMQALTSIKEENDCDDARALELMAADYLSQ